MKVIDHKKSSKFVYLTIPSLIAAIFLTSCNDGENCCRSYKPEIYKDFDLPTYAAMCENSMNFHYQDEYGFYYEDDNYDHYSKCKYKEVDRFIDAAQKCCAPLKTYIKSYYDLESFSYYNRDFSVKPLNAYTWCLLNTHPRTYQCDIEKASLLEAKASAYCSVADDKASCIANYMNSDEKEYDKISCCESLTEDSVDSFPKSKCIAYYYSEHLCVNSYSEECCRNLISDTDNQVITWDKCIELFYTNDEKYCINSDKLLEKYNSGDFCCDRLPEVESNDWIAKSECLEIYSANQRCVTTHEEKCCLPFDENGLSNQLCQYYYKASNGEECFNTEDDLAMAEERYSCCYDVPEDPSPAGLTKDICKTLFKEMFKENKQCINSDELYEEYKNNL